MNIHWKDWCWSWNSHTLATWCEELTHWKRLWCCERLRAGGERDNRGWDGWMASLTWWTWIWVSSGSCDGQGGLAGCNSWGCKESDTTERLNWTELTEATEVYHFTVLEERSSRPRFEQGHDPSERRWEESVRVPSSSLWCSLTCGGVIPAFTWQCAYVQTSPVYKNIPVMLGSLEMRMATHSSVLAWRIPWTKEPGVLSPWGCKKSDMTERLPLSVRGVSSSPYTSVTSA